MSLLGTGAASPAGEPTAARFGAAEVGRPFVAAVEGLPAPTAAGLDGRERLLAEAFDRLDAAATALGDAAENAATSVAAISARGDRIDRLQSENRSRLQAMVDRAA